MTRTHFRDALMAGIALACMTATVPASAEDLELRVTQGSCVCSAPLSVAIKKGFLDDELAPLHVKLRLTRLETGPAQTGALQSGALDIGLYGAASIALIANRLPVRFIMMADDPTGGEGLAVKSDIHSMDDLVGKKIATPLGTSGDVMLRGAMQTYHLPADKVVLVNLDPQAMAAAWERNDIQGAYIWDPWLSRLAGAGGHKLVTDGQIVKDSGGKYNAGWDLWVVRGEFAEQHPQAVRAFVRAMDKAAKYIANNPQEAAEAIYSLHGVSSAQLMLAQLNEDSFPTASDSRSDKWLGEPGKPGRLAAAFVTIWDVMHEAGKLRAASSLEAVNATIDPQYLQ